MIGVCASSGGKSVERQGQRQPLPRAAHNAEVSEQCIDGNCLAVADSGVRPAAPDTERRLARLIQNHESAPKSTGRNTQGCRARSRRSDRRVADAVASARALFAHVDRDDPARGCGA